MELACRLGNKHLPAYSSKFSRRDFTLAQLFACLVLRQFYNLSYRRTQGLLADCPDLRAAIGLCRTPDHNTICDAFETLTSMRVLGPMFDELAKVFTDQGLLRLEQKPAAGDATHFETHHCSRHFENRKRGSVVGPKAAKKGRRARKNGPLNRRQISDTLKKAPKLGFVVAAGCHLILAAWSGLGAGSDHLHAQAIVRDASRRAPLSRFVLDAGYDSEAMHVLIREELGCDAVIPPQQNLTRGKPPTSFYRLEMFHRFTDNSVTDVYGQRWQAETAVSMIKRNFGSFLRARTPTRQNHELLLKALTHNIAL